MRITGLVALVALSSFACAEKKGAPEGEPTPETTSDIAKPGAPEAEQSKIAPGNSEAAPKKESEEDASRSKGVAFPALQGIEPVARTSPSKSAREDASNLNREALALHRSKNFEEALAVYRRALAADPSHSLARYNLASMMVTMGNRKAALELLRQFRALGCEPCRKRLGDARTDAEWKPLWKDETFIALTDIKTIGPVARVVAIYFGGEAADSGGFEDPTAVGVLLNPPPGYARAPELVLTFKDSGKKPVVRRIAASQIKNARVYVSMPDPKDDYEVSVTANGKYIGKAQGRVEGDIHAPFSRRVRKNNARRCAGTACRTYPALSPGAKIVVARDEAELVENFCNPSTGELTTFTRADGTISPSVDVTGWEQLSCASKVKTRDGREVSYDYKSDAILLHAKDGTTTKLGEAGSPFSVELCASKKNDVIVLRAQPGLGGDCREAEPAQYEILSYD